jgi:hypothetical protein
MSWRSRPCFLTCTAYPRTSALGMPRLTAAIRGSPTTVPNGPGSLVPRAVGRQKRHCLKRTLTDDNLVLGAAFRRWPHGDWLVAKIARPFHVVGIKLNGGILGDDSISSLAVFSAWRVWAFLGICCNGQDGCESCGGPHFCALKRT